MGGAAALPCSRPYIPGETPPECRDTLKQGGGTLSWAPCLAQHHGGCSGIPWDFGNCTAPAFLLQILLPSGAVSYIHKHVQPDRNKQTQTDMLEKTCLKSLGWDRVQSQQEYPCGRAGLPQHWDGLLLLEVLASHLSSLLSFWPPPESSNGIRIMESLMLEKDL